jgi:hypothetical protein
MYGGMSKTAQVPKTSEAIPNWQISVNYVETCNCDYGCPCNFSGFPTYGFCRAIVFMRINKGNFGDTRLDGLSVVLAESWPKAIHEGDGTQQIYVSKEANKAQREAIEKIWYGRAKGNGHFAVFAGATKYFLEPQFVDIKYKIDGKNSSFSVPGIIDVQTEPFKNPVTGVESETEVHLPKGFIWQSAKACKTKKMRIVSPNLSFDESGKNAFFCETLTFKGP